MPSSSLSNHAESVCSNFWSSIALHAIDELRCSAMTLIRRVFELAKASFELEVRPGGVEQPEPRAPGEILQTVVHPIAYKWREGFSCMADAEQAAGVGLMRYLDRLLPRDQRNKWALFSDVSSNCQAVTAVLGDRDCSVAIEAKREFERSSVGNRPHPTNWTCEVVTVAYSMGTTESKEWRAQAGTEPGGRLEQFTDYYGGARAPIDEFAQLPGYLQKHLHEIVPPETRKAQWGAALGATEILPSESRCSLPRISERYSSN